jgi:hypothetical protein
MALSRNYSELKVATVWMCLADDNFHIKPGKYRQKQSGSE